MDDHKLLISQPCLTAEPYTWCGLDTAGYSTPSPAYLSLVRVQRPAGKAS